MIETKTKPTKSDLYFAKRARLATGWANNVVLDVQAGVIRSVQSDQKCPADATLLSGPVLPTLANVHSHAFQRVMAGAAEVCLNPNDSFWSWRDLMYKVVQKLTPEDARIIAKQLYIDMLKAGYSQVGEFHYLHHQAGGTPYNDPTEMAQQLLSAANDSGIGLTLLPVLYSHSGFGGQAPTSGQARFIHSTDSYLTLYQACESLLVGQMQHQLGVCFHSLRAVTQAQIETVLQATPEQARVHIHIAEQQKEVQDCVQWSGQRPVAWLQEHIGLTDQWCLVHATHLDDKELQAIARSNAVAGLCPTTEANLGDGIFPGVAFEQAGGRWGIGSDSHVSLSVVEELRTLEYSQRLRDQQRNRLYRVNQPRVGDYLFDQALHGGNQACDVTLGLQAGRRADFMVLDDTHPFIAASESHDLLNRWLFACQDNVIKDVFVFGKQVVKDFQHEQEAKSRRDFANVIKRVIYDA